MFCPNCGNNCGDSRFCSNCGQKLERTNYVSAAKTEYPPLKQPFVQIIAGKEIDLHRIVRTYGMGFRKSGAYYYLANEVGISHQQAKQILDPIYAVHAGEKISFMSSLTANMGLINDKKSQERTARWDRIEELEASGQVYCPECLSTSVSAQKKGFSVGRARLFDDPMAGAIGANEVQCVCLKCGHKWTP